MATVTEYCLIGAGIAVAAITAAFAVGDDVARALNKANTTESIASTDDSIFRVICEGPNDEVISFNVKYGNYHITTSGTYGTTNDGKRFDYSVAVKCWIDEIASIKKLD